MNDDCEVLIRLQDRCEWYAEDLRGLNFELGWGTSGLSLLADRMERMQAVIDAARAWEHRDKNQLDMIRDIVLLENLSYAVRVLDGGAE